MANVAESSGVDSSGAVTAEGMTGALDSKNFTNRIEGAVYSECSKKSCKCTGFKIHISAHNLSCVFCGHYPAVHASSPYQEAATYPAKKSGEVYIHPLPVAVIPKDFVMKPFKGQPDESFEAYADRTYALLVDHGYIMIMAAMKKGLRDAAATFYQNLDHEFRDSELGFKAMKSEFCLRFPAPPVQALMVPLLYKKLDKMEAYENWHAEWEKALSILKITDEETKKALLIHLTQNVVRKSLTSFYQKSLVDLLKYLSEKSTKRINRAKSKKSTCRYFNTSAGCRLADKCPYKHYLMVSSQLVGKKKGVQQQSVVREKELEKIPVETTSKTVEKASGVPIIRINKSIVDQALKESPKTSVVTQVKRTEEVKGNDKKDQSSESRKKESGEHAQTSFKGAPKILRDLTWEEAKKMMVQNMDPEFRQDPKILALLEKYKHVFDLDPFCSRISKVVKPIEIKVKGPVPPTKSIKKEKIPLAWIPAATQISERRIKNGLVKKANTSVVSKTKHVMKSDGTLRPATCYIRVNHYIVKSHTPLPVVRELIDRVKGHKLYCEVDAASCFSQFALHENSQYLTGYIDPVTGNVMVHLSLPQGLNLGSHEAQRIMNGIYEGVQNLEVFVDNITGYGDDFEEMLSVMEQMLIRADENDIRYKPAKCCFFVKQTKALGFGVNLDGSNVSKEMIDEIRNLQEPKDAKTLIAQLSLLSFSRDYIKNLGKLDAEIRQCTKDFSTWNHRAKEVWEEMKRRAIEAHPLKPFDQNKEVILQVDGSKKGWGSVLLQPNGDGSNNIIGWASGKFNKAGLNYGPTKGELFALKKACEKFELFLKGRKFKVQTDCKALCYGFDRIIGDRHGYMAIWANDLNAHFDFELEHVPGKDLILADAFSRLCNREGEEDGSIESNQHSTPCDMKHTKERVTSVSHGKDPSLQDEFQINQVDIERIITAQKQDKMIMALKDLQSEGKIWTRNNKIVIPTSLQHMLIDAQEARTCWSQGNYQSYCGAILVP